jgi:hypothetical protein
VQLTQSISASQALLHPKNPNPSYPEGFGTPHGSTELSSELVVWYYPPGRHVNAKNNKKGFATRHLQGSGVSQSEAESAIEQDIRTSTSGASKTGTFWGRVTVNGQTIEYRAYTLPNGTINIGTYYIP